VTLAQKDDKGETHIISHASRQLKENKKITHPFYLRQQLQYGACIILTNN